jgi:ribonuclease P protein component
MAFETLRKRADFLRAASARRQGMPGFLLQARQRLPEEAGVQVRVGYTCSKKIGNAVARNRAKRRLRALAREIIPATGREGWDYVLVGRPGATIARNFADLRADLMAAMARVHDARSQSQPRSRGPGA